MIYRCIALAALSLGLSGSASAQASRDSRLEILHSMIAVQVAARITMPFGTEGVQLSDAGEVDQQKLNEQIRKNGKSIDPGKVVTISAMDFNDRSVEIELDGGGKTKKNILGNINVGVGNRDTSLDRSNTAKAKGSKVVLTFAKKVPADLTADQLKQYLDPVMNFNARDFLKTGIDSLPPEVKAAVLAKKALIGMDRNTLLLAMDRPDKRSREMVNGVEQETWIYYGKGYRSTFVVLENNIVVSIKEF